MLKTRIRFYCGLLDREGAPVVPERYENELAKMFTGYTMYKAAGVWEGVKEPSLVFEVIMEIAGRQDLVNLWALLLREAGNQSAVLYTVETVDAYLAMAKEDLTKTGE